MRAHFGTGVKEGVRVLVQLQVSLVHVTPSTTLHSNVGSEAGSKQSHVHSHQQTGPGTEAVEPPEAPRGDSSGSGSQADLRAGIGLTSAPELRRLGDLQEPDFLLLQLGLFHLRLR